MKQTEEKKPRFGKKGIAWSEASEPQSKCQARKTKGGVRDTTKPNACNPLANLKILIWHLLATMA